MSVRTHDSLQRGIPSLKAWLHVTFSVNPSLRGQSSWVLLLPEAMVNLTQVIVKNFQLEIALRKQQTTQQPRRTSSWSLEGGKDAPC